MAMHLNQNGLEQLASRIRDGDSSAVTEFLMKLEPQLNRIIRQAIRIGGSPSTVGKRIVAAIDRMNLQSGDAHASLAEIVNRFCLATVDGLRAQGSNDKTTRHNFAPLDITTRGLGTVR